MAKRKTKWNGLKGFLRVIIGLCIAYMILINIKDSKFDLTYVRNALWELLEDIQVTTVHKTNKTDVNYNLDDNLYVHYIDIGQGDSTLIEYKDIDILIDGGDNKTGDQLIQYLQGQEIDDIDLMIGTHMDADHIGGLDYVFENFIVESVIDSGSSKDTKTYRDYKTAMKNEGASYREDKDEVIVYDDYLSLTIIETGDNYRDENDNSVVCMVTYGNIDFLFTGDMEKEAEHESLNKFSEIEVLKVGHHGSRTSSTESFLDLVSPEIAIISCGEGNKYGHPHKETLDKLNARNIQTYRTDELGTIILETDGNTVNVLQ